MLAAGPPCWQQASLYLAPSPRLSPGTEKILRENISHFGKRFRNVQSVQSPSITHGSGQDGISRDTLVTSPGAPWSWHQTLHWFTCTQRSRLQSPADRRGRRITANIISDILPKMTEEYLLAWNDHHATFFSAMSDLVTGIRERAFSACLRSVLIISGDDVFMTSQETC